MSDSGSENLDGDAADLAAEYVLGLIEGPDRAAARERLRADPALRAEVEAWEQRLAPLLDQVAPAPLSENVSARVWERIAAAVSPGANVVGLRRAAIWDRVGVWRLATAASLGALALTFFLRSPPPPAPAPSEPQLASAAPTLAATLSTPSGRPLFVATFKHAGVAIVPVGSSRSDGRHPELWIIKAGAKPVPVGMIDDARAVSLTLASARASDVFAVSLEPAGGSPTGAPTGPVIASGQLRIL